MLEGSGEGVCDGLEQNTQGIRKRLGLCAAEHSDPVEDQY